MSDDYENLFKNLTDREKKVLKERFGIDLTLPLPDDIDSQLNVTKQKIREIEEKALQKLAKRKQQIETNSKNCSFCEKSHSQVKKIIETKSGITICNECVSLCNKLIKDQGET
ncbi:hypothetical protein MNBD_BACTEROID05-395 [hydrothermal vent metagenome]|uniref:ClpX-type ZB domain-containing protein n=1 Tax=hydrothermal vent metagenome TaxID=652676 RepID=A0A3B0TB50_9ZZZZ